MTNMVDLIKELRARTHLGLTECKKALEEFGGDIEKAIEALQKRGLKKVDDLIMPTEGVVIATCLKHSLFAGFGFITEVNCQTDFGARSELFQNFVNGYVKDPNLTPAMLQAELNMVSNQLGEKVVVRRSGYFEPMNNSAMTVYNHHIGGKIAVLMQSSVLPGHGNDGVLAMLDNVAMQIAATNPLAVDRESVSADLIQKKIAFYEEEVKFKPEQVKAKILDGKMAKWYSEVTLMEQEAVWLNEPNSKQSVQDQLDCLGTDIVKINRFIRYQRGEAL